MSKNLCVVSISVIFYFLLILRSRYKIIQEGIYIVTSSIVGWISIFNENCYSDILIEEIKYRRCKGQLKLYGYVIMPNHIHLIISSNKISNLMRNMKSYVARKIIDELILKKNEDVLNQFKTLKKKSKVNSEYQIWQEGFHPKLIISEKELRQKLDYIHNNPVSKGLVDEPQQWKYSSYNNYFGGDVFMEIDLLS